MTNTAFLNNSDSPTFVQTPEQLILVNGSTSASDKLKLSCLVDSNPAPFIYWFKNGQQLAQVGSDLDLSGSLESSVKKANGLYTFSTPPLFFLSTMPTPTPPPVSKSATHDGKYTCKVRSGKFKVISSSTYIISEGVPSVIGDETFYAEEKKDSTIEFTVLSNPRLLQVSRRSHSTSRLSAQSSSFL